MKPAFELPDDWFVENDGQRLVLDPEKVKAAFEVRVAPQGWQPIESAPEETEILGFWQRRVHNGTDGFGATIWRGGSWRSVDAPNQKYTAPTHWQPLPPPPAASDREERR
jgi:hypothetical protein